MAAKTYVDLSEVMDTFDADETARLLDAQLEAVSNDSCEGLTDNFKLLYVRYASIRDGDTAMNPDDFDLLTVKFQDICKIFLTRITDYFNISIDEEYLADHIANLPSVALAYYLFFVLDLRSNLFNVLLSYISSHLDEIAGQFEELRERRDSISEINRTMNDQKVALVCSNIYDVVDWAMEQMDVDDFFSHMEKGYYVLGPMKNMYDKGYMDGAFLDRLRELVKENITMKARICFDIICRLKGYEL